MALGIHTRLFVWEVIRRLSVYAYLLPHEHRSGAVIEERFDHEDVYHGGSELR